MSRDGNTGYFYNHHQNGKIKLEKDLEREKTKEQWTYYMAVFFKYQKCRKLGTVTNQASRI
jgi:hypothetical protein